MLGRVTRAALVEQRPHPVFDAKAIMPRRDDIILVQDVAEEVAVIDFVDQRGVEIGGQRLEPGRVVKANADTERADPRGLARVERAIGSRERKRVGEGKSAYVVVALGGRRILKKNKEH